MASISQPVKATNQPANGSGRRNNSYAAIYSAAQRVLGEEHFIGAIEVERRRAERSGKAFLLMLADLHGISGNGIGAAKMPKLAAAFAGLMRETDITGWYQEGAVLGIIFTELGEAQKSETVNSVQMRVGAILSKSLSEPDVQAVALSFHFFPEAGCNGAGSSDVKLYREFSREKGAARFSQIAKRAMDIALSAVAIVVLSPVMIAIAAMVKLGSKGTILFRQTRVGKFGKPFTFLKFRSMYANNNPSIHQDYVSRFIAGEPGASKDDGNGTAIYKIANDPRVTRFGRFLRRTSLDELPQLLNVLAGDMSLIGPRPPVPYEFERYDVWHRRRVVEVKPGITGLWQVNGRSRTSFDEMVRLDLQYVKKRSLWLDVKILCRTPAAVFSGDGAY